MIADHQVGALGLREKQRFVSILGAHRPVSELLDDVAEELQHRLLVLGNEHQTHQEVSFPAPSPRVDPIGTACPVSSPWAERSGARTRMPRSVISNSRTSL